VVFVLKAGKDQERGDGQNKVAKLLEIMGVMCPVEKTQQLIKLRSAE
jgi:hypothetical protein